MPDWTSLRRAGSTFLSSGQRRRTGAAPAGAQDGTAQDGTAEDGTGQDDLPPEAARVRHRREGEPAQDPVEAMPDRVPAERAGRHAAQPAAVLPLLAEVMGADALAAATAVTTPGGRPVLAGHRAERAAAELAALDPAGHALVAERLRGSSDVLAAYLLATLATGRGADLVGALGDAVAGHAKNAHWLHRHLGVLLGAPGPATYEDDSGAKLRLRQSSPVTAGPAAMIMLRVLVDPTYSYWLTTGTHIEPGFEPDQLPFEQRFRAQQASVHDAISRSASRAPLSRLLGASPASSARFLNRFTRLTGARFGWLPVDGGDPAQVREALAAVGVGLDMGVPVPLYVGGHADRTVVLAFGRTPGALRLYDPAGGEVLDIVADDIVAGRPVAGGWDRLEGLLAPQDA